MCGKEDSTWNFWRVFVPEV